MHPFTRAQWTILVLYWIVCMELLTILDPCGMLLIAAAGMSK